jgi:hypothetical protein
MEFKEKTVDSLGPAVGSKPVINFRFVDDNFSFVPGLRIRICMEALYLSCWIRIYMLALHFNLPCIKKPFCFFYFFKWKISLKKLFVPGKIK